MSLTGTKFFKLKNQRLFQQDKSAPMYFLKTYDLYSKLTEEDYIELGLHSIETAKYIITTPIHSEKLDNATLCAIACLYEETALIVLKSPTLKGHCHELSMFNLAKKNTEIAMTILKDEELTNIILNNGLNSHKIIALGRAHVEVGLFILQNKALSKQFTNTALSHIALTHPECAKLVLETRNLKAQFAPEILNQINQFYITSQIDTELDVTDKEMTESAFGQRRPRN